MLSPLHRHRYATALAVAIVAAACGSKATQVTRIDPDTTIKFSSTIYEFNFNCVNELSL